jgi:purine nucleosidase
MQVQWKIQQFINEPKYPIALSRARQWNPFPWLYRKDCIMESQIGVLKGIADNSAWPPFPDGDGFMTEQLSEAVVSGEKVTMLVNCPLTTLRNVLEQNRQLESAIERLIWMGGAIKVDGNLDPATIPPEVANKKADWNAFCDPFAVDWIFKNTKFPIYLFPLDVTNQAAITEVFMERLAVQADKFPYSRLALQSYGLVAAESFYDMWDVVTTCYIPHPEFFKPAEPMSLSIVTDGFMQGALEQTERGRMVNVLFDLEQPDSFYKYVLDQFKR